MDKQTFVEILECALLSFDGVQETELIGKHGLTPELARIGVQLCSYLKSKGIRQEVTNDRN
jgi:hypothetical protein